MEMLVTWVFILAALSMTQFCFELRKLKRVEDDTLREFETGGGSGDRRDDDLLTICGDDQQCLEFDTQRLQVLYKNLFQTQEQLDMTRRKSKADRDAILRSESAGIVDTEVLDRLQGDGDFCCPTMFYFHRNMTLQDVKKVTRPIIHIPPYYQWIPHGTCLGGGNCGGMCINEPVMLHLLTLDTKTKEPMFGAFEVPGYCSCKNTS